MITVSLLGYSFQLVAVAAMVSVVVWKASAGSTRHQCEAEALRERQTLEIDLHKSAERQKGLEAEGRRLQEIILELTRIAERFSTIESVGESLRGVEERLQRTERALRKVLSISVRDNQQQAPVSAARQRVQEEARFTSQFEEQLNRIFEANAAWSVEQNKMALDGLLNSFREQLEELYKKLMEANVTKKEDRGALHEAVAGNYFVSDE